MLPHHLLPAPCSHPKPSVPILRWVIFHSRSTSLFQTAPFSLGTRQENALFPALLLVFPGAQGEDQAATELYPWRARRRLKAAPAPLPSGTGARDAPERCGSQGHGPARSRIPVQPRSAPFSPCSPRADRGRRSGGAAGGEAARTGDARGGTGGPGRDLPAALSPSAVCVPSPHSVGARRELSPRSWSPGITDYPQLEVTYKDHRSLRSTTQNATHRERVTPSCVKNVFIVASSLSFPFLF